jgi:hypothetical protein
MVLPYLKGLIVIKEIFHSVLVYLLWWFCIHSGIRALSWQTLWANFFYFCKKKFRKRKKRAATFQKFKVYLCEKFAEIGCISDFLLEKHPS